MASQGNTIPPEKLAEPLRASLKTSQTFCNFQLRFGPYLLYCLFLLEMVGGMGGGGIESISGLSILKIFLASLPEIQFGL